MLSSATLSVLHSEYDRIDSSLEEFDEDVCRIYSVIRMLRKYAKHGETKARLIINNIVILYNVFGSAATHALDEEADDGTRLLLDTCLVLMGREKGRVVDIEFLRYLEAELALPVD